MIEQAQRSLAAAIGSLIYENPFLPGRIDCERAVLGEAFVPEREVWSRGLHDATNPNITVIAERARDLADRWRELRRPATEADRNLYRDLVTYVLYDRYDDPLAALAERDSDGRVAFYDAFAVDATHFLEPAGLMPSRTSSAPPFRQRDFARTLGARSFHATSAGISVRSTSGWAT